MASTSKEYKPIEDWSDRDSYIDARGYRRVRVPEHPKAIKGYFYEHRLVIEAEVGRVLKTKEVVHHKDRNKINNERENLLLTTPEEHAKIHANEDKWSMDRRTEARRAARRKTRCRKRDPRGRFK